jgi:hypothetical protein
MIRNVKNWLVENSIYFDRITAMKLPALAYVDDRAIRFDNNWDDVILQIERAEQNEPSE